MIKQIVAVALVCCLSFPIGVFANTTNPVVKAQNPVVTQNKLATPKVTLTEAQKKDLAKKEKEKIEKEKAAKLAKDKIDKEKAEKEKAEKEKANAIKLSPTYYVTQQFKSKDGLTITADFYAPQEKKVSDTLIITLHRAGWSRGEYRDIAAFLTHSQYALLAIDQRSGGYVNGIINETATLAAAQKLPQDHPDALVDVEAAIEYATKTLGYKKVVLWGSSYSACLSLVVAEKYKDVVIGVISFSPGEYFKVNDKYIADYAAKVSVPTLIITAPFEKIDSEPIFNALSKNNTKNEFVVIGADNLHGSSMLWNNITLPVRKELWGKVLGFLGSLGITATDIPTVK